MTDLSPSEFVAAHELSRYPAEAVIRLIEAAREWADNDDYGEAGRLLAAIDALSDGES